MLKKRNVFLILATVFLIVSTISTSSALQSFARVDCGYLDAAIDEANRLNQTDYTPESVTRLNTALDTAVFVANNIDRNKEYVSELGTTLLPSEYYQLQNEINFATLNLRTAIDELDLAWNYTNLANNITYANNLNASDYTIDSWNYMLIYLDEAKILNNARYVNPVVINNVTWQVNRATIDFAADRLWTAIYLLDRLDYTNLVNNITYANNLNARDYTIDSWNYMLARLNEAMILNNTGNAQSQVVIDNTANRLWAAIYLLDCLDYKKPLTGKDYEYKPPDSSKKTKQDKIKEIIPEPVLDLWEAIPIAGGAVKPETILNIAISFVPTTISSTGDILGTFESSVSFDLILDALVENGIMSVTWQQMLTNPCFWTIAYILLMIFATTDAY